MTDFTSAQQSLAAARSRPSRRADGRGAGRRPPAGAHGGARRAPSAAPRRRDGATARLAAAVKQASDDAAAKRAAARARRRCRGRGAARLRGVQRSAPQRRRSSATRCRLRCSRCASRRASAPSPAATASQHQLWVRIYPDDCSIDTFEDDAVGDRARQCQAVLAGDLPRRRHRGRPARRLAQPGRGARLGTRRLHRRHLSADQPAAAREGRRRPTRSWSSRPRRRWWRPTRRPSRRTGRRCGSPTAMPASCRRRSTRSRRRSARRGQPS